MERKFQALEDVRHNGVLVRAGQFIRLEVSKIKNCMACKARREWFAKVFKEVK